ncbi:D-isomer specific 2-hydroxyacid dehydrogenase family protein [Pseudoclavibacter soli]|uniref:D-isomer specific 2-hydroxyacid dehydrogenase family protein n=1 Tax=Pseudoclavibacter soli TaxID=452623 RepID=UPI000402CFE0|nr:D-isomer specific 2-hydroxyacid dehydrogenase family protein [Pseudoclavibacter soli]
MSIAVLPEPKTPFVKAVAEGGVTAEPLSEDTTAVVWLDPKGADALDAVLAEHPAVTWVQLPFAGVDAFIPLFARYPQIRFTSAKGAYDQPVAEHALALTLAVLREFPHFARAQQWQKQAGRSLFGLRVAVVGAGGIGREIVRLLQPFDTHITVVRRRAAEPVVGADQTVDVAGFKAQLQAFDVVILAAALTADTKSLLGAGEFAALPDDAVVINIARGPHIDTDALVAALRDGQIAGAGLDVTDPEPLPEDHPLWSAGNILITPHTANTWAMAERPLSRRIANNVRAFEGEGEYEGVVDIEAGY